MSYSVANTSTGGIATSSQERETPQSDEPDSLQTPVGHPEGDDDSQDNHCPICLESFQVGDSVSWSRNLTHCR